jgi:hypothetical protein
VEARSSRTVFPPDAAALERLKRAIGRYEVEAMVVHGGSPKTPRVTALRPGVQAVTLDGLGERLARPAPGQAKRATRKPK